MKPDLCRRWDGPPGDLRQLKKPAVRCSIRFMSENILQAITFWDAEGKGITIQSEMIDLAERTEVGVVVLSMATSLASGEIEIQVEEFFGKALEPFSLVVKEADHAVESGLCLSYGEGCADELVIVAGACPYSIAIDGLMSPGVPKFTPEYPMDRYSRLPIVCS